MRRIKYITSGLLALALLYVVLNQNTDVKNKPVNQSLAVTSRPSFQKQQSGPKLKSTPSRSFASIDSNKSPIEDFPRQETGIPGLQIVAGVSSSNEAISSKTLLMKSGNMFFYQEQDNLIHNVVYDKRRNSYALWTGIISLKAKQKSLELIRDQYAVSVVGNNLLFAANLKIKDGFDVEKDLAEIVNTSGVYEVKLNLIYARLTPK